MTMRQQQMDTERRFEAHEQKTGSKSARPNPQYAGAVVLPHDVCFGEPALVREAIHPGIKPRWHRTVWSVPQGRQPKPLREHGRGDERRNEMFLDFDPVSPEWPLAEEASER